jgi:hypothetical protein
LAVRSARSSSPSFSIGVRNRLIAQRKIVKASGRDTGDSIKLSRDKITDILHKPATALKKNRGLSRHCPKERL